MRLQTSFSWRVPLLFTTIGPPIGALIWLSTTQGASGYASFGQALADALIFLVVAIPMSWVFGLVPAVLTGLLLSVTSAFAPTALTRRKFVVVLLGAVLGYIATLAFKWLAFNMEDLSGSLPLEEIGALSAAACSVLVRTAWVSPNKSFTLRGSA